MVCVSWQKDTSRMPGVDSVYYAGLGAETRWYTDEEFAKWIKPFDLKIMKAIKDAGGYCFLHMCKSGLNMKRYDEDYAALSDVVNWGVYEAPMSLEDGKKQFPGKTILGGLENRSGVLVDGDEYDVRREVIKGLLKTSEDTALSLAQTVHWQLSRI